MGKCVSRAKPQTECCNPASLPQPSPLRLDAVPWPTPAPPPSDRRQPEPLPQRQPATSMSAAGPRIGVERKRSRCQQQRRARRRPSKRTRVPLSRIPEDGYPPELVDCLCSMIQKNSMKRRIVNQHVQPVNVSQTPTKSNDQIK